MPRYTVEQMFSDSLQVPNDDKGIDIAMGVVNRNADPGVNWLRSSVSHNRSRTFCVYNAPSPAAVWKAAEQSVLPVERITKQRQEVQV